MSTTRPADPFPNVTPPADIENVGGWDLDGYRDIFGFDRTVTDHRVRVYAFGSQASDGRIYDPTVQLAEGEDDGPGLNSDQARELAAALLQIADEIDGWWA